MINHPTYAEAQTELIVWLEDEILKCEQQLDNLDAKHLDAPQLRIGLIGEGRFAQRALEQTHKIGLRQLAPWLDNELRKVENALEARENAQREPGDLIGQMMMGQRALEQALYLLKLADVAQGQRL
jgi:capsule polysaccharide export protein KpsE/RkpR